MNGNGDFKKTASVSEINRPPSEDFKVYLIEGETEIKGVDADGVALTFGPNSGNKPKIYKALLTQVTTGDPTAVVLENELGAPIVWTRDGQGEFIGTLAGAFVTAKTGMLIGQRYSTAGDYTYLYYNDVNSVILDTQSITGAFVDDVLEQTLVVIEVYS